MLMCRLYSALYPPDQELSSSSSSSSRFSFVACPQVDIPHAQTNDRIDDTQNDGSGEDRMQTFLIRNDCLRLKGRWEVFDRGG